MAIISNINLLEAVALASKVEGDFAEVGVFRGDTFKRLALLARATGRISHAFDSFQGMAPPTELDGGHYPSGKLSVGGIANFERIMAEAEVPPSYYRLHPGFIPECFNNWDQTKRLAFALIDVDQYQPTLEALRWIWPRLTYGGIMVCDDYFPGRSILASGAIDVWMRGESPINLIILKYDNTQLIIQKTHTSSLSEPYANILQRM